MQKISDNHSALGVIGGGTINTGFGNFRFNSGSGKNGIFHEKAALGMKNVTTEFAEYGLEEIGEECISTATESEKEYILPMTVGGTKVHLFLGAKNT